MLRLGAGMDTVLGMGGEEDVQVALRAWATVCAPGASSAARATSDRLEARTAARFRLAWLMVKEISEHRAVAGQVIVCVDRAR